MELISKKRFIWFAKYETLIFAWPLRLFLLLFQCLNLNYNQTLPPIILILSEYCHYIMWSLRISIIVMWTCGAFNLSLWLGTYLAESPKPEDITIIIRECLFKVHRMCACVVVLSCVCRFKATATVWPTTGLLI